MKFTVSILHSLFSQTPTSLSSEDRRQNVINNPHLVDWFFTKRFEAFLKHWLYDTLGAEWHWYRYEFQARGSIHCHGTAKLNSDPGLCRLTDIALRGVLAEQKVSANRDDSKDILAIQEGKRASEQICEYVDSLLSTCNPTPPESEVWTKPTLHPCRKFHEDILDADRDNDYADLLNTVQRHTRCSTKYCLRQKHDENHLQCRFNFPFECCAKTKLEFEQKFKFKFSGPSISSMPNCVPIPPITATVNLGGTFHERQQVPLKLAWALTIHKSQGLTLQKTWIDIGKKESTLGISYVAISRVQNLSSLVIEPMAFDRLRCIKKSESLKYRQNEEIRLQNIADQTIAPVQD